MFFFVIHFDQGQRMSFSLVIPTDLRSTRLLFVIVSLAPPAIVSTINSTGVPPIHEQVIDVMAGSPLGSEHVKKLLFGVSAFRRSSISTVTRLIVRIEMWRDVNTGTWWRIAV